MTDEQAWLRATHAAGVRLDTCPRCHGGYSAETSMSLFVGVADGCLIGKCHRATCGHTIFVDAHLAREPAPVFVPKPLTQAYRNVLDDDHWGREWASARGDNLTVDRACEAGLRVLADFPNTCVWQLHALSGERRGHITRTRDKTIRTYKEVDKPLYYTNCARASRPLFLFEDPMSAAVCQERAVALLGTSISDAMVAEIAATRTTVFVCLDPGAEDAALRVYEKLRSAGVTAIFVPMNKDYKDMTRPERDELMRAYA